MSVAIDTSVLIELERRRLTPDYLELDEPIALSAISVSELLVGAYRSDTSQQRRIRTAFLELLLERVAVLPFDTAARIHAEIVALLISRGQRIGAHDTLIAATAMARGYAVLTDNLRDFGRVPGFGCAPAGMVAQAHPLVATIANHPYSKTRNKNFLILTS